MHRRHFGRLALGSALGLALRPAAADSFPTKPIRLLVGYPPGGQADSVGRLLARELGTALGGSVIVENRQGAKALIAAEAAAKAPADGYTLLLADRGVLAAAPAFETELRFDPEKDLLPLARAALVPYMLVTRAGLDVASVPQLISRARANPGKLSFAYAGELTQIAIEILEDTAKIDLLPVPYKSAGQAALDVAAGRVDLLFSDTLVIGPMAQAGTIRVLASTGGSRSPLYPDAPTMAESGFPDFVWFVWHSVAAPAGVPKDVVARLLEGLKATLASSAYRSSLARLGFEPIDETPAQFAAALRADRQRFSELARRLGKPASK
jgi:tripartite-type tricarboxylate transporter receptor subunit TctC